MQGLKSKMWVMVCDGKKAIYLENAGTALEPQLEVRQVHEHEDPANRDINSDTPGRTWSSDGKRSAMDEGDAHDLREKRFLKAILERLEKFQSKFQFRDLILVAPPRALGVIRQEISPQLRDLLRAEIEKDLVNISVPDITHRLVTELKQAA